ncbi:MAG: hypothetical protein PVI71_13090, partial [Desulfobacterales bacterium]
VVFNDWSTARLCHFPPMVVKFRPRAVRLVVDLPFLRGINRIKRFTCRRRLGLNGEVEMPCFDGKMDAFPGAGTIAQAVTRNDEN